MRFLLVLLCALLVINSRAGAATYYYSGAPISVTISNVYSGDIPNAYTVALSGQASFGFDTSNFSGIHNLDLGDTASFLTPGFGDVWGPGCCDEVTYPNSFVWFDAPNDSYGVERLLTGSFVFQSGKIVSWSLTGNDELIGCGLGPGCVASGALSVASSGDSISAGGYPAGFYGSNITAGSWIEASVPEPSTWAMMLLGFASIGFIASRRKRRLYT